MGFIPGIEGWFTIQNTINIIHHSKKLINKNHRTIPINTEKYLIKSKSIPNKNSKQTKNVREIPQPDEGNN